MREEVHEDEDKERLKLNRAKVLAALLLIFLLGILVSTHSVKRVKSIPVTWTVDDDPTADFNTIQEAIDSPLVAEGDIVFVRNGTYHEHVFMNKSISLLGESSLATVIDGNASESSPVVLQIFNITNAVVRSLTVRNTTASSEAYGILIYQARNLTVQNTVVTDAYYGILVGNSTQCKIFDNRIIDSHNAGIVFRSNSSHNTIVGNLLSNNPTGIYIEPYSQYNVFYHNNIVDNTLQFNIFPPTHTLWNNGVEGNFWSDYTPRVDINGDGIGDTPYLAIDSCPLIEPWNQTRTYPVNSDQVTVNCNYTVASFAFNALLQQISFHITGPSGWSGFCNITIPTSILNPQPPTERWIVMMGSNSLNYRNESVGASTRLSFNYTLSSLMSENQIRIRVGNLYPPTASFQFTPDPASILEPVNFTDTSTNSPNGTIVWRQWDLGDGHIVYNETFVYQFGSKELFNVTLTVGDDKGMTDSVTLRVWVRNLQPSASFSFWPASPSVGLEVNFNASESRDLDGSITEYRWRFGDNTAENATSATTPHKFEHVGAYNVTLTVIDDDGEEGKIGQIVPVGKGGTYIDIDAPTAVTVEERFTINVTLLNEGTQPVAFNQITIQVYNDNLDFSRNVNTDTRGIATTTLSVNTTGEYMIKAGYYGSSDYNTNEQTSALTVDPISTSLLLHQPEDATQNKETTIIAVLRDASGDPVYNATVEFHLHNGSAWELLGTSQTNQSGIAAFSYTLTHAGTFTLKATYNGDGTRAASTSNEHTLTVTASETDYLPYIVLAAIIAAIGILLFIVFRRRTSKSR